jgi:hypothetical protein
MPPIPDDFLSGVRPFSQPYGKRHDTSLFMLLTRGATVVLGWFVLHSTGCGTEDHPPATVNDGGSGGGQSADVFENGDTSTEDSRTRPDSVPGIDSSDPTSCAGSMECDVVPKDCCNIDCATTELIPVSAAAIRDYFRSCTQRGCTPCPVSAEWVSRCINNRCSVVDLGSSSFSVCKINDDCKLRWGSRCCDLCHPNLATDLVSVARAAMFCDPDYGGCDPCSLAPFPEGATAVCLDGHCSVQR